jgi:S1-C subfamily serine protease
LGRRSAADAAAHAASSIRAAWRFTAPPPPPGPRPPADPSATDPIGAAHAFAEQVDAALVKSVATVRESSVTVWNLKKMPAQAGQPERPPQRVSGGSGVLLSIKGKGPFVISNEHVVQGADVLEIVMYDGKSYPVTLKDHVKQYDIALLEFGKERPKSPRLAKLGESEQLAEGQWVIATGNPFFLGGDGRCVATLGVISGLDRTLKGDFTYAGAIQHDAEVNPGNSGGPLWNLSGELVGINGMISSRGGSAVQAANTGASFAIPIHLIERYFDALLSDKVAASAGYLGVEVVDAKDPQGKPVGAEVRDVRSDSPAKKGDGKAPLLEKGDVITQISLGTAVTQKAYPVFTASDLTNALAPYAAGTRARISFTRAGKKLAWSGELTGAQPAPKPAPKPEPKK